MKCALIVTLKVSKQPWRRFQVLSFLFEEFQSILQDEEENPMRAYWMAFLDMTQVLLDYAKFICIGNWELSGCFWTYAFIVSCLWPPKLIAIFPAIGVGRSWSKTSILQSTKLSSRKISQQKERLESLICYRWTRLSSKRSINNKARLEPFNDGLSGATLWQKQRILQMGRKLICDIKPKGLGASRNWRKLSAVRIWPIKLVTKCVEQSIQTEKNWWVYLSGFDTYRKSQGRYS